ncbi:putative phytosulfokines 6 isoform X2 [Actinidia eriantha]|uniref:putative phytosulfokines 6 isoform X2 n=1 Tax=Actinidia eriantha TaxID=165200 RepID=UPI0025838F00|nr:putative phytosulfokines 6 isoform X2 [Actinidia eriantha]
MKQNHFLLLLFLLFLVTTAQSSARILATKQGEEMEEITSGHSLNLMGVEDCQTGQEECLKRRMIAEAHLDYIYTQHHKP